MKTKNKIKRSCSLRDLKEIKKLAKSTSLENIKTEEIENIPNETNVDSEIDKQDETTKTAKINTFQDIDINKINKIMCIPDKCKLMQKALDLGLHMKNIVECLLEGDYLDEEKFFEKLIESVVKSSDGLKGNNKEESYDLFETVSIQEGNLNENSDENKSQLNAQKQKNSSKLNSNLRPIVVDGIDVATRYCLIINNLFYLLF